MRESNSQEAGNLPAEKLGVASGASEPALIRGALPGMEREPSSSRIMASEIAQVPSAQILELDHPIGRHALSRLRDFETKRPNYRLSAVRLLTLLLVEATRSLPASEASETHKPQQGHTRPIVFLSMGAEGLGLTREASLILPGAVVGNIGFAGGSEVRLHLPHAPALAEAVVILCDPVYRAGGSTRSAVAFLRQQGAKIVRVTTLVATRAAVEALVKSFPGVQAYVGAFDAEQDDKGMPLPGIGDFPQRFHGE